MTTSEIGLIGSGIEQSLAPMLHETLGRLTGRPVRYALYEVAPHQIDDVDELLTDLARRGAAGVNITHPFKEHVAGLVDTADPNTRLTGAVNTIRFDNGRRYGHNTDYSGFIQAYLQRFPETQPGVVAQLGAGGVGRAAAFALAALDAEAIGLYDLDPQRAARLANDISTTDLRVTVHESAEDATVTAHGVVNCSPVGMHNHPGCPVDPAALTNLRWAFDAVYNPTQTELLTAADQHGAECMTGAELFLWQGVHAHQIFQQTTLDDDTIQAATDFIQAEITERDEPSG